MKIALTAFACWASIASLASAQDHSAMHGAGAAAQTTGLSEPGQGAFAAIQEAVEHLSNDPATDWSRVNVERLRQHLIDMDEVTLHSTIVSEHVSGGERFRITGAGRTLQAIRGMVVGHARAMGDAEHWTLSAEETADGAVVTALAKQPSEIACEFN